MKTKQRNHIYLYICLLIFFIISITTIFSAQSIISKVYSNLYTKQLMWYILGFLFCFVIRSIGNEKIYRYAHWIYFSSIFLLILVLIVGKEVNNTKGWITIGNLSFQPSEFTKIGLILMISKVLNEFHFHNEKNTKKEFILILKILILTIIPSVLVFIEPDTGSVISYFIISFIMIFISGLRARWFIILFLLIGLLFSFIFVIYFKYPDAFINFFGDNFYYRVHRLIDWSKQSGMQLENSLIAIGSSGILGHGFNKTPIYFPEPYADFIFTVFASNYGFIGSFLLIIIIILFDYLIINIALKCSKTIDKYVISGILAALIYSQIQNIGMTIGIVPIAGVPLPFISYGGSSLIISFIMIGLIINAYKEKSWFKN